MKLLLKITWMLINSAAAFQLAVAAEQDQKTEALSITVSKPIYMSGYTQVRYQFCQDKNDGFDVRRVRLSLKGKLGKQLGYRLQTEFGGSSPKLMDAELTFDLHSAAKLSVGQFIIPFSQENLASNTKLEAINRSQVVEALAARGKDVIGNQNGRDIGFQVSGSFVKTANGSLFDYALGIFNGSGINVTSDLNEEKDVAGRLIVHPFGHLSLGGSFYTGKYTLASVPDKTNARDRIGAELSLSCSCFSLTSEYIKGTDGSIEKAGWYVQTGCFLISKKLQAILKYDTYDPNVNQSDNAGTVYTVGVNLMFNDLSRLQINYELKDEQGTDSENDAFTAQLQFGF